MTVGLGAVCPVAEAGQWSAPVAHRVGRVLAVDDRGDVTVEQLESRLSASGFDPRASRIRVVGRGFTRHLSVPYVRNEVDRTWAVGSRGDVALLYGVATEPPAGEEETCCRVLYAAVAHPRGGFSRPRMVSAASADVIGGTIEVSDGGRVAAAWSEGMKLRVAAAGRREGFGRSQTVLRPGVVESVNAGFGGDGRLSLTYVLDGSRIETVRMTTAQRLEAPRDVTPTGMTLGHFFDQLIVRTSADGDQRAIWDDSQTTIGTRTQAAAVRSSDGRFHSPRVLATNPAPAIAFDSTPTGNAIALAEQRADDDSRNIVMSKAVHARSFGPVVTLARPSRYVQELRGSINRHGDIVVAWRLNAIDVTTQVQALTRPAGGSFGELRSFEVSAVQDLGPLVLGRDRRARLTWTSSDIESFSAELPSYVEARFRFRAD